MHSSQPDSTASRASRKKEAPRGYLHTSNQRNRPELIALRMQGGWLWYGWHEALLEVMRESPGFAIRHSELRQHAFNLQIPFEDLKGLVDFAVSEESGAFVSDGTFFSSVVLNEAMEEYQKKVEQNSAAGQASAAARAKKGVEDSAPAAAGNPTPVEHPLNTRSTDVQHPLNTPNIIQSKETQSNATEPKGTEGKKTKTKRPKYREFNDADFAWPSGWDTTAIDQMRRWVEYKERRGEACLLESYQEQVNFYATRPRDFVADCALAIRNSYQGIPDRTSRNGGTSSAHDKVEQTIRTNLSLGEQLRLRGE